MCGPIVLSNWSVTNCPVSPLLGAALVYPNWNQPPLIRSGCKSWLSWGRWRALAGSKSVVHAADSAGIQGQEWERANQNWPMPEATMTMTDRWDRDL